MKNAKGRVFKYGDNVDTDVIIPARYLNVSNGKELAKYCMIDIDADFVNNVKKGDIMVAAKNFGCGSSREHAPLAIKCAGISCVIASTFARIFYRNAINIGLPILECKEAAEDIQADDIVSVDFNTGIITNETTGKTYRAEPFPPFMQKIMAAGGLVTYTKEKNERIGVLKMGTYQITVLKGDGIGPDIVTEAMKVLECVGETFGHHFIFNEKLAGGCAYDAYGVPLPDDTLEACKNCDSILLGAVGGPKWDSLPAHLRPEAGALLKLRSSLGLYANLRPAIIHKALSASSPIKPEIIGDSLDILVVRELTGGIYFGERGCRDGKYGHEAFDVESYSEFEVRRIAVQAFEAAMKRGRHVTSIDKANVLESSRLWRRVVTEAAKEYPEVTLDHMYVDNAAMQLVRNPKHFDVIVTSNIFGDIISDEASQITGSIGMLPSASLSDGAFGMYEPIHGSAPDIAGKDMANPIATILSAAMMLKFSFGLETEAKAVEDAVTKTLDAGYRTPDIFCEGMKKVGTKEMGRLICEHIAK